MHCRSLVISVLLEVQDTDFRAGLSFLPWMQATAAWNRFRKFEKAILDYWPTEGRVLQRGVRRRMGWNQRNEDACGCVFSSRPNPRAGMLAMSAPSDHCKPPVTRTADVLWPLPRENQDECPKKECESCVCAKLTGSLTRMADGEPNSVVQEQLTERMREMRITNATHGRHRANAAVSGRYCCFRIESEVPQPA